MGPIEALKLALSKEIEAARMYEKFSGEYPVAKDIFSFLVGEEQKHKKLIEKRIAKLSK
jgi:rubrerythrin